MDFPERFKVHSDQCIHCTSVTYSTCLICGEWVCGPCRTDHVLTERRRSACSLKPLEERSDRQRPDHDSDDDSSVVVDDFHGPQPDPAKIEAAVDRVKKLEPQFHPGPLTQVTKEDAEIQDENNRMIRKILRNALETKEPLRWTNKLMPRPTE